MIVQRGYEEAKLLHVCYTYNSWVLTKCSRINLLAVLHVLSGGLVSKGYVLNVICTWSLRGTIACQRCVGAVRMWSFLLGVLFICFCWDQESDHNFGLWCLLIGQKMLNSLWCDCDGRSNKQSVTSNGLRAILFLTDEEFMNCELQDLS